MKAITKKINKKLHAIVYFSPSNARCFFNYIQEYKKSNKFNFDLENVDHICFGEKTRIEFMNLVEGLNIPKDKIHVCQTSKIDEILILINKLNINYH